MTYHAQRGYSVPIGLLRTVLLTFDDMEVPYRLDNQRRPSAHDVRYEWNDGIKLRDYQMEAIEAITEPGVETGLGILKMPIRSGKTKTAAGLIHRLGKQTLFIVPSQMLLHQTHASLSEALCFNVGRIGDSHWDEKCVTVATVQTLSKVRGEPRYRHVAKTYDLVIFDESHHLRGDVWHKVVMDLGACYRVGLSATVYFDSKREQERGVIWLRGCCGEIRIDVSTTRLIEAGYLMRQNVELHRCNEPQGFKDWKWSQELRDKLIYMNDWRNRKIVELAAAKVREGLSVLIVSNRLNQIRDLAEKMTAAGLDHRAVTGKDRSETRAENVEAFTSRSCPILIGTVFGEGIDIPEVEVVINAEGGRDMKASVQRMRNMTPHAGKTEAIFIDFMDTTNPYFAGHSAERLASYRAEPAFNIRVVE